ncbi:hypothetical protein COOONC_15421 [Cooperia oncophora]
MSAGVPLPLVLHTLIELSGDGSDSLQIRGDLCFLFVQQQQHLVIIIVSSSAFLISASVNNLKPRYRPREKPSVPRNPSLLITQVQKNGATNGNSITDVTNDDFRAVVTASPTILPDSEVWERVEIFTISDMAKHQREDDVVALQGIEPVAMTSTILGMSQ